MQCDLWFPTPIWHTMLDIDNQKIYEFCEKIRSIDSGRELSNYGGWQSNDIYPSNHAELEELSQEIFKHVAIALDCYKYNTKQKTLFFHNSWINVNDNKHNFNRTHIHSSSIISGVYYLKCNENSGKICFPRNNVEDYIIQSGGEILESNQFNYGFAGYKPKESLLLLFPSYVPHYVEPNEDNSVRMSIAFNIGFK